MDDGSEGSYLEKISGAIVVVPNSTQRRVNYLKGRKDGSLAVYRPKQIRLSDKIKNLVDKKVIFIPLQTNLDRTAYESYRIKTQQIPLELKVTKVDEGIERTIRKIITKNYNPFTEEDAKYVSHFIKKYVYPDSLLE